MSDLIDWFRANLEADKAGAERILAEDGPNRRWWDRRLNDVIADAEAKMAIVDLYEERAAKQSENAMEEDRTWTLERTVRFLAWGMRHRPGYLAEWAPEGLPA